MTEYATLPDQDEFKEIADDYFLPNYHKRETDKEGQSSLPIDGDGYYHISGHMSNIHIRTNAYVLLSGRHHKNCSLKIIKDIVDNLSSELLERNKHLSNREYAYIAETLTYLTEFQYHNENKFDATMRQLAALQLMADDR